MRSYKLRFSRFEMDTDHKATGKWKKKLQRQVRSDLKREAKKEIEDVRSVRSQYKDEEG